MPDFLVGSGQTYTTIQGAIDAVAAIGDLAGLGDHNIIVDDGHAETTTLTTSSLQAKVDGQVFIQSSGTYTLTLNAALFLQNYLTVTDIEVSPNAGYSDSQGLIRGVSTTAWFERFKLTNPNNITTTAIRGGARANPNTVRDGTISGFLNGCVELNTIERVTVDDSAGQGIVNNGTVVDCVAINSAGNDFSGNTSVSYCASEDATASGTGSITNIDPAVEFTDAAGGDFTLANSSQLVASGSTGNNIGWDQTEVNVAPVRDTAAPDFELQKSQIWSYDFGANFSDANTGDTETYSINPDLNAVTGFTFNTATGVATADATKAIAAGVEYTITRTDSGGLTANDVLTITVVADKLTIGTISDTSPEINTQITVEHSNALGTLTTPDFPISSQNGTQAVLDIVDITTLILSGQTYPTINFNTAVAIPLSDGMNSDNVDLDGIQNPAGTLAAQIAAIPSNSIFANDVGAVVGMHNYFFDISGNIVIDATTGVVMSDDNGGSYSYKLYNDEWGAATTNTISARPQSAVSIDSIAPSRNGAVIEFSYSGVDATGFQYRLDGGSWVSAVSPLTLSGLDADTAYSFEITAVNNGRTGDITPQSFTTQEGVDTTPNSFSFAAQTGIALNAAVVFGPVTVTGVDAGVDVPVSVNNGTYSVSTDGGNIYGAETSANSSVRLNYLIRLHHNSAGTYETQNQTTLTVGGFGATGSSTTVVDPATGISESSGNPLPASFYVRVGASYSLSQHVNNTDSVALTYAIAQGSPALPAGVSLNASTGEITTTDNNYTPVNGISFEVTVS